MTADRTPLATDDQGYEPMAQAVARHLRQAIVEGRLAHGTALRQEAIARELGVSRIPVREALQRLQVEGLVTIRPHSGARVALLDFAECVEIYKIRERIEPLALGESIEHVTSDEVAVVAELAERLDATDDLRAWVELDRRMHLAAFAGTQMPRLTGLIDGFWDATRQYRRILLTTFTPKDFALFQCDHRLIVEALETNHRRLGEDILRLHIDRALRRLSAERALFNR
jgi:DNA-binding GntR family transcriptional regulator